MSDYLAVNIFVKHIRYVQNYIRKNKNSFENFNNYKIVNEN